jgi:hypothetical protein
MKHFKSERVFLAVALGAFAFLLALSALLNSGATPSYADTVPTPAAVQAGSGGTGWLAVTFDAADSINADEGTSGMQLAGYDTLDIQYVVDQADAATNTTTVTLQWSNDNSNWSDGPALVSANSADADGMLQVANMGRYTRIYYNVTNSNAMTWTVKAIAKP